MPRPDDLFSASIEKKFFYHTPLSVEQPSKFEIYPIHSLPILIKSIKEKSNSIVLRYLVDWSGQIWFAKGGCADSDTPMHYQMTGKLIERSSCLAAGYLVLAKNHQEIIRINNDSGFRSTLDSIKWPLIILVNLLPQIYMSLSSELVIEQLSPNGAPEDLHSLNRDELETWVHSQFDDQLENFIHQPNEIRMISFPLYQQHSEFFSSPGIQAQNESRESSPNGP